MKKLIGYIVALSVLATSAFSVEVINKNGAKLDVGGRLQTIGTIQYVDGVARDKTRLYLFNEQSRLGVKADINDFKYVMEVAFGGEETAKPQYGVATSPLNSNLSLQDFYSDFPYIGGRIRVGQFKPALNRESLASDDNSMFAKRSLQNMAVEWGRDVGAAYYSKFAGLDYTLGIFTGGGANIPERYIPEVMKIPMIAFKIGINNGLDSDIYTPAKRSTYKVDGVKSAFYLNGFYTEDSLVGHGTVLSLKYSQRSLIINTLYNPFLVKNTNATLLQVGAEGAYLMPWGKNAALSIESELNYTSYQNDLGNATIIGGLAQALINEKDISYGARFSVMRPSMYMTNIGGHEYIYEFTPTFIANLNGDNAKIILDAPMLFNTLLATDSTHGGTYEFYTQPDSIAAGTYNKTKYPVTRGNAFSIRLMAQFTF